MRKPVLVKVDTDLHRRITAEAKKTGMLIEAKYNEVLSLGVNALRLRKGKCSAKE